MCNTSNLKQFNQVSGSASHNDSTYFPSAVSYSMHTSDPIDKSFGAKGYAETPNRESFALNNIEDCIIRKDSINARLTDFGIDRNKAISKHRYIVEQHFGISHKNDNGN